MERRGPNSSYGIIVEGPYDTEMFKTLIRRIVGDPQLQVDCREADNDGRVVSRAAVLLHSFKYVTSTAGPVDKALVIRDTDLKDPATIEALIRQRIEGQIYPFPNGVSIHGVVREAETWLLADSRAIAAVAARRTGQGIGPLSLPRNLERVPNAKETFMAVLESVGLPYTPQICAEIAAEMDLPTLRAACPSFNGFEQKVLDP